MPKLVDLTGKTFGRLYVVGRARDQVSAAGNRKAMWACICSCGGDDCIKAVLGCSLTSGHTTSCGCVFREMTVKNFKDLTGQRFGRLVVLSFAGKNKHRHSTWLCKCDCNNEKIVEGGALLSEATVSCGCYHSEIVSNPVYESLVGKKFGRLTVISQAPSRVVKDKKGDYKQRVWLCVCGCERGTELEVCETALKTGHTKSCGCLQKEIVSELASGVNNWNWKGGATPLQDAIRTCALYLKWREAVFQRDNYTCKYSGEQGELVCHHIKPFYVILEENNITTLAEALACEELWLVSNGVTLLKVHHNASLDNPKAFHSVYGNKSTEQDFYKWLGGK